MGIDIQWPLVLFTLTSGVGAGLLVAMGITQLACKPAAAGAKEGAAADAAAPAEGEPEAKAEAKAAEGKPEAEADAKADDAKAEGAEPAKADDAKLSAKMARAFDMPGPQKVQFTSVVASLVLLVLGGCFSLLHLASPQNVMAAVFNIFSFSGISIELILLGFCVLVALGWAIAQKRDVPAMTLKVFAVLGIVFGLLLLFFCGHGYVMVSRPAWDTDLLPFAYLGTGLLSGIFAYGVVVAKCWPQPGEQMIKLLKLMFLGACIVCAASCVCYGAAVLMVAQQSTPVVFWFGLVLCGIVAPIAGGIYAYQKLTAELLERLAVAGLVVALIAVLGVRIVMWDTSEGYLELFSMAQMDRVTGNSLFHWGC